MIFAIAAFAVVMVLGTVFLTAGYANYSKLFGRKNDRQDYYTLVSTAKYVGSQLDGATVRIQEIYDDDDKNIDATKGKGEVKDYEALYATAVSIAANEKLTGTEADWVAAVVKKACYNETTKKLEGSNISYLLQFENEDGSFQTEVSVTLPKIEFPKNAAGDYEPVNPADAVIKLKMTDGNTEADVEFTISPANTLSYSIAKKTTKEGVETEIYRLTKDTVYTFRMGDIITGNG